MLKTTSKHSSTSVDASYNGSFFASLWTFYRMYSIQIAQTHYKIINLIKKNYELKLPTWIRIFIEGWNSINIHQSYSNGLLKWCRHQHKFPHNSLWHGHLGFHLVRHYKHEFQHGYHLKPIANDDSNVDNKLFLIPSCQNNSNNQISSTSLTSKAQLHH